MGNRPKKSAPISFFKGDTQQVSVSFKNNEEPWTPTNELVVFAVGKSKDDVPLFTAPVVNGVANITHKMTKDLTEGKYNYDVRVYTESKSFVATACYGDFELLGVVNDEL